MIRFRVETMKDQSQKPDTKQLGVIGHNVVIDNGTASVKAGFSTADAPQCRIPTVVGHGRHKVRRRDEADVVSIVRIKHWGSQMSMIDEARNMQISPQSQWEDK